jgi:hypothetical protein
VQRIVRQEPGRAENSLYWRSDPTVWPRLGEVVRIDGREVVRLDLDPPPRKQRRTRLPA